VDAPSLLVVVVNYRTADVTVSCLRSLAREVPFISGARVVVVDNGSGDGSAARIQAAADAEGWRGWTSVLGLRENGGFAYGNNRGVETAPRARFYLLLNSDTVVAPGALRYCLGVLDRDPTIGAMSCMLRNEDGSIQNVARKFPTPLRRAAGALGLPWRLPRLFGWADLDDPSWDRSSVPRDVDWLGGAFLLVRGDVLRSIGGLDEDFFFYGEDIAFCHRVWRTGRRCRYDPGVSVVHYGGTSSDPSRLASGERLTHAWRARHLVHEKLYGARSAAAFLALDRAIHAARVLYYRFSGRSGSPESIRSSAVVALLRQRGRLAPYRPVGSPTSPSPLR
jgi:N-acetylglucosaminyl-diphospho-decaprenol L-rhamnosyltransferase